MTGVEGRDKEGCGLYLYCLVRGGRDAPFSCEDLSEAIGGNGDKVFAVSFLDLSFVVSNSSKPYHDPIRANLMAHQKVIEAVMERGMKPLPVRFGTVARHRASAPAADRIGEVLRRRYGEFEGLLGDMENKTEVGLKAFWRKERVFDEIVAEYPDIRRLRDRTASAASQGLAGRDERLRLGTMVSRALETKREQDARRLLSHLTPVAYDYKTNKVSTDMMILNGAFLVCNERTAAFDAAVQEADERFGERMSFKYVGPLPPFNFIEIVVHWEEEE